VGRFFVEASQITGNAVSVTGDDARHLIQVLRANVGQAVEVSDGEHVYQTRIRSISDGQVFLDIVAVSKNNAEPGLFVTLYQAIAKGERMDWAIQKAAELGAGRIVPVLTRYTVVQLDEKKAQKRMERYQRIAAEAAKQCRRGRVPEVTVPVPFAEAMAMADAPMKLIAWEQEEDQGLSDVLRSTDILQKVDICIGPEGGFAEEEIKTARDNGWRSVGLGPRILRTETAGITLLSILMYRAGEM
jgi:16S rRNA (uracil1498-N3)-methyltransferase